MLTLFLQVLIAICAGCKPTTALAELRFMGTAAAYPTLFPMGMRFPRRISNILALMNAIKILYPPSKSGSCTEQTLTVTSAVVADTKHVLLHGLDFCGARGQDTERTTKLGTHEGPNVWNGSDRVQGSLYLFRCGFFILHGRFLDIPIMYHSPGYPISLQQPLISPSSSRPQICFELSATSSPQISRMPCRGSSNLR